MNAMNVIKDIHCIKINVYNKHKIVKFYKVFLIVKDVLKDL